MSYIGLGERDPSISINIPVKFYELFANGDYKSYYLKIFFLTLFSQSYFKFLSSTAVIHVNKKIRVTLCPAHIHF